MVNGTREKPILPKPYQLHRGAADHLVDRGLAEFRGYDGKSHGGYWLTAAGRATLAASSTPASDQGEG